MNTISPLKQARLDRGWSRADVETRTEGRIVASSLERWETGKNWPHDENIAVLCKLYGKSAKELGLDTSRDIMGNIEEKTAPNSQEEEHPIMSDLIRRSALSDLGSYLTSLVSTWPRRNHHYGELQAGINRAIVDHSTLVGQDSISVLSRRQALVSFGLIPIRLSGALPITNAKKSDTDTLLTHCAAGIAACWYLRRGKELKFVNDLTSSYISILQPLVYSQSEAYRKAAAGLLAQCLTLKSKLVYILQDDDQEAITYEAEAIRYAQIAENEIEQVIANREMALYHWWSKRYEQALPYASMAYGRAKNTSPILRSFAASGLSFCQAACGHTEDAKISLKEACDLFDPTIPVLFMPYRNVEVILLSSRAAVYRHIGDSKQATNLCQKILARSDLSPLNAIHERIKYAEIEVTRDDIQTRDMGLCVKLLTEAIIGAKEWNSKNDQREAREVYNLLRVVWPREDAIKQLGKDHFGIK